MLPEFVVVVVAVVVVVIIIIIIVVVVVVVVAVVVVVVFVVLVVVDVVVVVIVIVIVVVVFVVVVVIVVVVVVVVLVVVVVVLVAVVVVDSSVVVVLDAVVVVDSSVVVVVLVVVVVVLVLEHLIPRSLIVASPDLVSSPTLVAMIVAFLFSSSCGTQAGASYIAFLVPFGVIVPFTSPPSTDQVTDLLIFPFPITLAVNGFFCPTCIVRWLGAIFTLRIFGAFFPLKLSPLVIPAFAYEACKQNDPKKHNKTEDMTTIFFLTVFSPYRKINLN